MDNPKSDRSILFVICGDLRELEFNNRILESCIDAINGREGFKFDFRTNISFEEVKTVIQEKSPKIVHFIGHGDSDAVLFGDELIPNEEIIEFFKDLKNKPRLIIFSSCESWNLIESLADKVGISCIGSKYQIANVAIKGFTKPFYVEILKGGEINSSIKLANSFLGKNKDGEDIFILKGDNIAVFSNIPEEKEKPAEDIIPSLDLNLSQKETTGEIVRFPQVGVNFWNNGSVPIKVTFHVFIKYGREIIPFEDSGQYSGVNVQEFLPGKGFKDGNLLVPIHDYSKREQLRVQILVKSADPDKIFEKSVCRLYDWDKNEWIHDTSRLDLTSARKPTVDTVEKVRKTPIPPCSYCGFDMDKKLRKDGFNLDDRGMEIGIKSTCPKCNREYSYQAHDVVKEKTHLNNIFVRLKQLLSSYCDFRDYPEQEEQIVREVINCLKGNFMTLSSYGYRFENDTIVIGDFTIHLTIGSRPTFLIRRESDKATYFSKSYPEETRKRSTENVIEGLIELLRFKINKIVI